MTLRQRTAFAVLAACTVAIVVLYFTVQSILAADSAKLERQRANDDLQRASAALNQDIAGMETAVGVWAPWDDTYRFMQDRNQQYIAGNLSNPTLVNLGIDFIIYVDTTGQIFYSKAVDASIGTETPIPSGIEQFVTGEGLLARHSSETGDISGILILPEHLALVASQPILTSQKQGPIAGSLVVGRYLDLEEVQKLSKATGLSIGLHRVDDPDIPEDFKAARSSLSKGQSSLVQVLDGSTIAAYVLVNDVNSNPAFVLRVDEPREISAQGRQTASHILYLLLGLSALFTMALIIGIDMLVMSRLRRLSRSIAAAGKSSGVSQRVSVGGRDEVTAVADAVNQTLASLEQSQHDLVASEARNRVLVDGIPDLLFRMDTDGKISDTRIPHKASSAGDNHDATHGQGTPDEITDLIPNHIQQLAMPHVERALESKETQVFEFQMSVDGSVSYHEARVLPDSDRDALIMVRDITDRKLAEEARRSSLMLKEIQNRVKNHLHVIKSFPEENHQAEGPGPGSAE